METIEDSVGARMCRAFKEITIGIMDFILSMMGGFEQWNDMTYLTFKIIKRSYMKCLT